MLLINLVPPTKRHRGFAVVKPFISAVSALSLLALFSYVAPSSEAPVRPLTQEERQVVLSLLGSVETKVPELKEWTLTFTDNFSDESVSAFVEKDLEEAGLARFEEDTAFFSPSFFGADSMSQERSILRLVVDSNAPLKIDPAAEIAVVSD